LIVNIRVDLLNMKSNIDRKYNGRFTKREKVTLIVNIRVDLLNMKSNLVVIL